MLVPGEVVLATLGRSRPAAQREYERIASEPSRGGGGPERFPDRYAQAAGNRAECSDQRNEHGSLSRGAGTKNKTGSAAANSVIVELGRLVLSVLGTVDTKTYEPMVHGPPGDQRCSKASPCAQARAIGSRNSARIGTTRRASPGTRCAGASFETRSTARGSTSAR